MDTDTTNPAEEAETHINDTAAHPAELDEENIENPSDDVEIPVEESVDDEGEEVELDGQKYRVPKALKDSFLRQADYTRKTQELAEQRRTVEAEREAVRQATEAEMSAFALATGYGAQIDALDQRAAAFGGWSAWVRGDPAAANEAHIARTELERARHQATGKLTQLRQQRATDEQQESARRVGEAAAVLEREIGWSPTKAAELLEGGIREYRFERAEIERFEDARMVLALHDALQWRAHQQKEKAASRHQAAQAARPAAKVQARSAPPSGLDDRLPADEWVRRRNDQLRRRG